MGKAQPQAMHSRFPPQTAVVPAASFGGGEKSRSASAIAPSRDMVLRRVPSKSLIDGTSTATNNYSELGIWAGVVSVIFSIALSAVAGSIFWVRYKADPTHREIRELEAFFRRDADDA